jgi:hypothetical protein
VTIECRIFLVGEQLAIAVGNSRTVAKRLATTEALEHLKATRFKEDGKPLKGQKK